MNLLSTLNTQTLIADGAMGSLLLARGATLADCLERLVFEAPELIIGVHRDYFQAGATLLFTHSFGSNPIRLRPHGLEERCAELNARAVALARTADPQAFVAGCIGPTGLRPDSDPLFAETVRRAVFLQAQALVAAQVDALALETFTHPLEFELALQACRQAAPNLPLLASVSPNEQGLLAHGSSLESAVRSAEKAGVAAFGINCDSGPSSALRHIVQIKSLTLLPILIKPSAGLPQQQNGTWTYPIDAPNFAKALKDAFAFARILGGCCGSTPEHIRALSRMSQAPAEFPATDKRNPRTT